MPTAAARTQLLADIIVTAVEGGTGYWAQVSEYKHDCPPAETYAVLHEWNDETDSYEEKGKRLDVRKVRAAMVEIARGSHGRALHGVAFRDEIQELWNDPEGCDWDADTADGIAQVALLGAVTYG